MFGQFPAKNNSVFILSNVLTTIPLYMKITTDVRAWLIYYIITNNMYEYISDTCIGN